MVLRDAGFDGAARRVCVDYIGSHAADENRFYIPGTTIDWCNQASCTTPTATPLGLGGQNWTGPYAANACFQMNVGQPVPFVFVADVLNQGGNGTHTVGNGQTDSGAHWGVFPYPFAMSAPIPANSTIIGVGLSHAEFKSGIDDDHQDLAVRFIVQPGPGAPVPTLGQWDLVILALAVAALGFGRMTHAVR